jgi:hypothetical protein
VKTIYRGSVVKLTVWVRDEQDQLVDPESITGQIEPPGRPAEALTFEPAEDDDGPIVGVYVARYDTFDGPAGPYRWSARTTAPKVYRESSFYVQARGVGN